LWIEEAFSWLEPILYGFGAFQANEDVTQHVEMFKKREMKWPWLAQRLVDFTSQGAVLIFVTRKDNSEEVANSIQKIDIKG